MSFIEQNCTFTVEGKSFTSGGALLDDNGRGIFYAYPEKRSIGNWHGDMLIPATYGREYRSNFGDRRQTIYFEYNGEKYIGVWYTKNWSQIVRVRRLKTK